MKPKITTKQLFALNKLMGNLKEFSDRGYGSINQVMVVTYVPNPNNIYVKYEKVYEESGSIKTEYVIVSINGIGEIDFIQDKFKDMFERAAFLSECVAFNIENPKEYEKID